MLEGEEENGKVEKGRARCVSMQLSLGMDLAIPIPNIARENKRICRKKDTDNM